MNEVSAVVYLAKLRAAQTLLLQAGRPQMKANVERLINRPHIDDSKAIYRAALKNSPTTRPDGSELPNGFEIRRMVCNAWKLLNNVQGNRA